MSRAIGEVKATTCQVGLNLLQRLRHIRSLLLAEAVDGQPKLLLFSRQGFTRDLIAEARTSKELELIALPRLYTAHSRPFGSMQRLLGAGVVLHGA